MSTVAYYMLHYGAEYLDASIRSVAPCVDKIFILYTPSPSHGFGTRLPCPDTAEELLRIATGASPKVIWHPVIAGNEGVHRSIIFSLIDADVDLVVPVDADEVWDTASLEFALEQARRSKARYFLIDGFVNFWRSFRWACYDHFHPVRIINVRNEGGEEHLHARVYHFSTAQRWDVMRYKYQIFGHRDEVRKDWLEKVYKAWRPGQGDLHPVALGLWNAEPFDPDGLPDVLKQHPNYGKEYID